METAQIIEWIQADVTALGAVGDEAAASVASRIAAAMGPPLRVRLIEALTEAAAELGPQLPDGRVEVRLVAADPVLVYVDEAPASRKLPEEEPTEARITLRLPESLKSAIEAAASREGLSVNTWLLQVLARSVETRARRGGHRLTGFARS